MTRRAVLAAAVAAPLLAGCTSEPDGPPPPDPLAELAVRARADTAAAEAVAAGVAELAAPAAEVARVRAEHAAVLQAEVDRERPPKSTAASSPATSPAPPIATPADPATARTWLIEALLAAEQGAAAVVPAVPRYRAGMVGSVAAACASLREVLA
ncbi:hypothetical protein [Actinokineospora sp.]|uniref:hypothetical protein n=1 Tax=Actinokineospora sp. TaxID=1872133 RepID=UPI004037A6A6